MKADFPYQRIGPRTSHISGRDSLWLGMDHVLQVHNNRFVEKYQRFDLRDIQAIVIRKQARFVIPVYWGLASLAALIVLIAGLISGNSWVTRAGAGSFLLLIISWLTTCLGRSCSCQLVTAVDSYELPGLYRASAARRVLAILESRISEVQGVLPPDWTADEAVAPERLRQSLRAHPENAGVQASVLIPVLACVGFFIDAFISWLVFHPTASRLVHTLSLPATLAAVVLAIVAIVVTRDDKSFTSIRIVFLVAVFAVGLANYGTVIVSAFLTGLQRAGQASPTAVTVVNSAFYWVNQIAEIGAGGLGLLILLIELRKRSARRQPSALQLN